MKSPPQKFDVKSLSKKDAQQAFQKHGAIVLTNLFPQESSSWGEIAAQVPHIVWDEKDLLLRKHRADPVHEEHRKLSLAGEALHPHSDGYIWGDCFPDLVILVCEEPAGHGQGANYLIDGYDVLARLKDDTKALLENSPVDHTERAENSFVNGAECIVPVIRYLDPKGWRQTEISDTSQPGRLCWRRMVTKESAGKGVYDKETGAVRYTSLWTPVAEDSPEQKECVWQALAEIDTALVTQALESSRFTLEKGEALIVDNYRMLHSREAFHGFDEQRRMWRVWSWTNASFGLPPQIAASTESGSTLPANILEAEKSIAVQA